MFFVSTVAIDTFCTGHALTGEPFICDGPPAGPSWAAEDSKGFSPLSDPGHLFPAFFNPAVSDRLSSLVSSEPSRGCGSAPSPPLPPQLGE